MELNNSVKKFLSLILVASVVLSLCACKKDDSDPMEIKPSKEFNRLIQGCLDWSGEELFTIGESQDDGKPHNAILYHSTSETPTKKLSTFKLYDCFYVHRYIDKDAAKEAINNKNKDQNEDYSKRYYFRRDQELTILRGGEWPCSCITSIRSKDCIISFSVNVGPNEGKEKLFWIMELLESLGEGSGVAFYALFEDADPVFSDGKLVNEDLYPTEDDIPLVIPHANEFDPDTVYVSYLPEDLNGVWLDEKGFFLMFDIENKRFFTSSRSEFEIVSIANNLVTVKVISKYDEGYFAEYCADNEGNITFPVRVCEDGSVNLMGHRLFSSASDEGIAISSAIEEISYGEYISTNKADVTAIKKGVTEIKDCLVIESEEITGFLRISGTDVLWYIRLNSGPLSYRSFSIEDQEIKSIFMATGDVWIGYDSKGVVDYLIYDGEGFAYYLEDGTLFYSTYIFEEDYEHMRLFFNELWLGYEYLDFIDSDGFYTYLDFCTVHVMRKADSFEGLLSIYKNGL